MQYVGERLIERNNRIERESDKMDTNKQAWSVDGIEEASAVAPSAETQLAISA